MYQDTSNLFSTRFSFSLVKQLHKNFVKTFHAEHDTNRRILRLNQNT